MTNTNHNFNLTSFNDEIESKRYFALFGLDDLLGVELAQGNSQNQTVTNVDPDYLIPYGVEIQDLCRLHWLCLNRKSTQVLEFGSGYSTLVIAHALSILRKEHLEWALRNTRLENPFKIYSVDESPEFANITRSRLAKYEECTDVSVREVYLTEYDGRFATLYKDLPNVTPDFIYLDGPSQYATTEAIAGFSIDQKARMPMAADILRFEYFLEPGSVILVDGRSANASFLKNNFQRNWLYRHDAEGDYHIFELHDPFLGELNENKFKYCTENKWILTE